MQELLERLPKIQGKIKHGSTICPKADYPMMLFLCGYLYHEIPDMEKVYSILECLQYLKAEGKITETIEGHLLISLYENPKQFEQISSIIDKILNSQPVHIFMELEKLQQQALPQEDINNIESNKLTKNGTVELPDSIAQNHDNMSEHTEKYDDEYFDEIDRMNKQSEAFARKLQEEEQRMAKLPEPDDDAVCEVCYVGLYDEEFLPLEQCEHIYHKNCLSQFFKAQISENKFPLKCPNDKCGLEVKDNDIRQILEPEIYKKYEKHTLKYYADMNGDSISWCPTADCEYMFFFEKEDEVRFECLECKKQYCLNCRVEWHKDMTCKQYQVSTTHSEADEQFMKFVKGKKFKQCPKCKFWVQKNQGCDHMTCKCKFQFCYKCGGVYGKCECITKMQEEVQRRRRNAEERQRKKKQRMEKLKQKSEAAVAPVKKTRKRNN